MTSEQKVALLLDLVNTKISIPKLTTETVKVKNDEGKLVNETYQKPTGSFEISFFNNEQLEIFKNRIISELYVIFPEFVPKPQEEAKVIDINQTKLDLEESNNRA